MSKLVDLNPLTDHGTQLYFDGLRVGDATAGLNMRARKRLYARFLNFSRNLGYQYIAGRADATWEGCFTKSDLSGLNPAGSPALAALLRRVEDPRVRGLAVRFRTYRTLYWQNGIRNNIPHTPRDFDELEKLFSQGHNFSNPVYSMVCGVITPWLDGEFDGHPGGRILMSTGRAGVTFAEITPEQDRLTLDFGSTIPEADIDLAKVDVGDIEVIATRNGRETLVATIPAASYDRAAYERTGGLIDLDISALSAEAKQDVLAGNLSLRIAQGELAGEQPLLVSVEDRDVYLDEGETRHIKVTVLQRGAPATLGVILHVFQYDMGRRFVAALPPLTLDGSGSAMFEVKAQAPGFHSYVFVAADAGAPAPVPPQQLSSKLSFHLNVRTLPFDDALERSTGDHQLSWDWVYANVLAFWDIQNPVMARRSGPAINRPLHDRAIMEWMTGLIRSVTSRNAIESFRYMPVTRDLSDGKRRLLHRWCDLVEAGRVPESQVMALGLKLRSNDPRVFGTTRPSDESIV